MAVWPVEQYFPSWAPPPLMGLDLEGWVEQQRTLFVTRMISRTSAATTATTTTTTTVHMVDTKSFLCGTANENTNTTDWSFPLSIDHNQYAEGGSKGNKFCFRDHWFTGRSRILKKSGKTGMGWIQDLERGREGLHAKSHIKGEVSGV